LYSALEVVMSVIYTFITAIYVPLFFIFMVRLRKGFLPVFNEIKIKVIVLFIFF